MPFPNAVAVAFPRVSFTNRLSSHRFPTWADALFQGLLSTELGLLHAAVASQWSERLSTAALALQQTCSRSGAGLFEVQLDTCGFISMTAIVGFETREH